MMWSMHAFSSAAWIETPMRSTVGISVQSMVVASQFAVDPGRCPALAEQQACQLIPPEEPSELGIGVSLATRPHARHVADEHAETTDDERSPRHAEQGTGQHVEEPRAHEPLPASMSLATVPRALVAGSHRPQVHEAQLGVVPAACDPATHAASMAVDAVPHDLANEATDLLEALAPVQLDHARRHLVADCLADERAARSGVEPGLAAARAEPWVAGHPGDQVLEVGGRQLEVEVELAHVVEFTRVDRRIARVERFDHARPDVAGAAVLPAHDA